MRHPRHLEQRSLQQQFHVRGSVAGKQSGCDNSTDQLRKFSSNFPSFFISTFPQLFRPDSSDVAHFTTATPTTTTNSSSKRAKFLWCSTSAPTTRTGWKASSRMTRRDAECSRSASCTSFPTRNFRLCHCSWRRLQIYSKLFIGPRANVQQRLPGKMCKLRMRNDEEIPYLEKLLIIKLLRIE